MYVRASLLKDRSSVPRVPFWSSLLLGKVTIDRTRNRSTRRCLDTDRLSFSPPFFFAIEITARPRDRIECRSSVDRIANGRLSFRDWHLYLIHIPDGTNESARSEDCGKKTGDSPSMVSTFPSLSPRHPLPLRSGFFVRISRGDARWITNFFSTPPKYWWLAMKYRFSNTKKLPGLHVFSGRNGARGRNVLDVRTSGDETHPDSRINYISCV